MTDNTTQAVAEDADAQPNAGSEAVGARETELSLDEILDRASSEAPASPEPSQQTAQQNDDLAEKLSAADKRIQALEARLESQDFDSEFDSTAKDLSDGLDVNAEDFKDALYGRVARDDRLRDAFDNRKKDPSRWKDVMKALKADYAKKFPAKKSGDVDDDVTASIEAAAATVRGETSTRQRNDQPSNEDVMTMSEAEFNALQRKHGVSPFS